MAASHTFSFFPIASVLVLFLFLLLVASPSFPFFSSIDSLLLSVYIRHFPYFSLSFPWQTPLFVHSFRTYHPLLSFLFIVYLTPSSHFPFLPIHWLNFHFCFLPLFFDFPLALSFLPFHFSHILVSTSSLLFVLFPVIFIPASPSIPPPKTPCFCMLEKTTVAGKLH